MPYTPYHSPWEDFPNLTTPITAAALDYIEAGIVAASQPVSALGYFNVLDYGALGDTVTFGDGAISIGSQTFTSTDATFAPGDVGKVIVVKGAGPAYAAAPAALETTISAFGSAHSVTLTDAASATVTDALFVYGTDDTVAIQAALDAAAAAAQAAAGSTEVLPYDPVADQAAADAGEIIALDFVHNGRACVIVPGPQTYLIRSLTDMTHDQRWPDLRFSTALLMPNNVELVGAGLPRLYCNADGQRVASQVSRNHIGQVEGFATANWAVRGITFDGGYVYNQYNHAVGDEIAFPDALEDFFAISFSRVFTGEITGCKFIGIYGDAIRLGDGYARSITVNDNYFTLFNGQAAQLINCDKGMFCNNICFDAQAAAGGSSEAMNVNGGGKASIIQNIIVNCGTIGAFADEVSVTGNYVAPNNGASAAIELSGTSITATGNVVDLSIYSADIASPAGGISVTTGFDVTVSGNVVTLSGGSMNGNVAGIGCAGAGSNNVIANNTVVSVDPVVTGNCDIFSSDAGTLVTGNVCSACPTSIKVQGADSVVSNNQCSGRGYFGASADVDQHILVVGNKFVGKGTLLVISSANTFVDNYLDASLSTNNDFENAIYLATDAANSNVFRNNTILGASGINVQGARGGGSPYGFLDIFDNNLLLGGGIFNLFATQIFRRDAGSVTTLAYSGTIATDANLGELFTIAATNGTAFTISNPTSPCRGMKIVYDIKNSSGGALGTITWGNAFLLAGAFTNPANGKRRTIEFYYDGTNWVEVNRAAADI